MASRHAVMPRPHGTQQARAQASRRSVAPIDAASEASVRARERQAGSIACAAANPDDQAHWKL
jgi:hypothetical protein